MRRGRFREFDDGIIFKTLFKHRLVKQVRGCTRRLSTFLYHKRPLLLYPFRKPWLWRYKKNRERVPLAHRKCKIYFCWMFFVHRGAVTSTSHDPSQLVLRESHGLIYHALPTVVQSDYPTSIAIWTGFLRKAKCNLSMKRSFLYPFTTTKIPDLGRWVCRCVVRT